MPNQDGTGPDGKGPKTGRGQGKCKKDAPKDTDDTKDDRPRRRRRRGQ